MPALQGLNVPRRQLITLYRKAGSLITPSDCTGLLTNGDLEREGRIGRLIVREDHYLVVAGLR